jgi:hypothetical protein
MKNIIRSKIGKNWTPYSFKIRIQIRFENELQFQVVKRNTLSPRKTNLKCTSNLNSAKQTSTKLLLIQHVNLPVLRNDNKTIIGIWNKNIRSI